ncbi:MAG TPA: transcription-repair coupling factor [Mycobacteriales bacterium]|jgi:transcription-repair coupling factor (superfamily II helicase)|nr:transcription-repair coupling factor [Mycobacteriales bacterium]
MSLAGLHDAVVTDPALAAAVQAAGADSVDLTAPEALRPFAVAALAADPSRGGAGRPVLAVTATSREADDLAAALTCLLPPDGIVTFPSWETLPHERLSPRADTVGRRLAVLRRLAHPSVDDPTTGPVRVVVAPVRSLLQPMPRGLGDLEPVELAQGGTASLDEIVERLVEIAYARVDLVEKRGEFAVRGGILDVFPPTEQHPIRVEFWGDEVEEVRYFAVADQRSLEIATHGLWAPPCRELLLTREVRDKAVELALLHPELAEMMDKLGDGIPVEGMESLTPALLGADNLELLLHAMPKGTHVLLCDPERIRTRAHDLVATSDEFLGASWAAAAGGGIAPVDLGAAAFRSLADVRQAATELDLPWWSVSPFGGAPDDEESTTLTVGAVAADNYRGETDRAVSDVRGWAAQGWATVLVFAGHGTAQRAVEVLAEHDLGAVLVPALEEAPAPGSVTVTTGRLDRGFTLAGPRLAILGEADITGARVTGTREARLPSRRRNAVDPLQLQPGDYVVHEQHGVGRYIEMIRRTINGGEREYLILEYAPGKRGQPGDRLFVPTDALDQLTRYVGGEAPALHRMGGADWQKTKGRARKAVKEIAGELIRLYAARTSTPGHAFGPDTPWQRELEDAFPFTETPDQLTAIDEVKVDMEKAYPMDRVIAGDVGYGKTEIAVRAAFKAVQDGKQVAVLVPTTLLAKQHFQTFSDRMSQFPVSIAQLSRFQTDGEAAEVVRGLAEGSVDIVVGTHRLLQNSTRFKDLGLVIVDEEQRFGVEHKEHLKQVRASVDVLTMSATPIPRTLEMSMTGIREMSTILTPPEERHPVLTYVGPYEERQISAAIRRELLRDGQVYYLHNRVESIERAAQRLRDLVPEARVAVAHGQMHEDVLEKVMVGFDEKEFDVLVSTTIVESGLDIPNANTLVVERADAFGLSQLHQIRGRVGRARERAYAYFLYPPEKPLTETAHDRLATLAQNTDLGSGMAVAMKDLEIRGAGNLLGGEQSGHIAGVGFDLYVRLVGEAVSEFKGEKPEEQAEVKVDLPVDAHLPHDYVPGERLRLEAYRKLAAVTGAAQLEAVREEVLDRYGVLPQPVQNLFAVAAFRVKAREAGLTEVSLQGKNVRFSPMPLPESKVMRLTRLYPGAMYKQTVGTVAIPQPTTARIGGRPLRDTELLDWASGVIDALAPERVAG